ncbi:IS66 family insertion sequence element accessory protein TnpB [Acidithiobacillus ferriphilus]|uniref:IS66 family insertion sequence element accessory protein TnpB n=1 Tax=Acidithiobacillus ferriphilus TaxID=1689834 RepID=UPI002DBA29FD|nr:IS66 family insertion sequence element accessory protein TnpB [Acidithiobacillus ferriphilus]MEB8474361.1 IS66 family insertion sequence element accessory protein TnpB [Acidithiobacillus ferriphilus]
MIRPEQVLLAVEPVDMRMGVDGLSTLIQEMLQKVPCDGNAYALDYFVQLHLPDFIFHK